MRQRFLFGLIVGLVIGLGIVAAAFLISKNSSNRQESLERSEATISRTISPPENIKALETSIITEVVDGDTVVLSSGERMRLIGIDSPESSEAGFGEARAKLTSLVLNKEVRLERDTSDRDRYGRLLRYLWIGDTFINLEMVRSGWARAYRYPPDTRYADQLSKAEEQARARELGLWGKEMVGQTIGECSSDTYNCIDFKTRADAQAIYDACGGRTSDIHKLDRDGDGIACEGLP